MKIQRAGKDSDDFILLESLEESVLERQVKTPHVSHGILEHLVNHLHLAHIEVNRDLKVVHWNDSAQTIWNYSLQDAKGKILSDLVLVEENRKWFNDFLLLIISDPQYTFDIFNHVDHNGKIIFCEWYFYPLVDEKGFVSGISMVVRDITKSVNTENELEAYRKYGLERIFQSAPIGIYLANMDGSFINVNPELAWMLGYESSESLKEGHKGLGKGFFADEQQRREFFFYILEAEQVNQFRAKILRKDGTTIWTLSHAQITQNETGRPNGFFGFLIDITSAMRAEDELKQAKEIAESATKAKSDFLANMSHEIRTPLNAIIGFTNLVLKSNLDEKQRDYISKVRISGRTLLGIINDILDFSKIEAGKLELEHTDFNLYDLLDNLSDMFANSVVEKKIELIISASPNVPFRLKGDPVRLNQILINLINNAIKFTKTGEVVVWVSLVERDGYKTRIQFSVSDTGIGMTTDQKLNLFESFSQADTSTTRNYGGTGLGLSISKKLVEMMNGRIWVKSEAGRGSTFAFHVMLTLSDEKNEMKLEIPERISGLRILVQDENPATREVIMMILICYSFSVRAVSTGKETIEELERERTQGSPYEMVIINWQHGGVSQRKTTQEIREWESKQGISKKIPIIITLNFGQEEERTVAEKQGASAFVFKPIKQTQLIDTIFKSFGLKPLYLSDSSIKNDIEDDVRKAIKGAYVLLVDDNEINREVATETMNRQGMVVDVAESGQTAVDKVIQKGREVKDNGLVVHPYDAVLMDLQMPGMDGYTASELIRSWEKIQNERLGKQVFMPIIAMSAHALSTEIEKCQKAGMNDYVSKPIEPSVLFSQLAKWVKPVDRCIPRNSDEGALSECVENGSIDPLDEMGELCGIDVISGLSKVSGNKELYTRLLYKFHQTNKNCIDELKFFIKQNDFEQIKNSAHNVKGVSGNLGMSDLFRSSDELEKAAKGLMTERVESCFEVFASDMEKVIGAIEGLTERTNDRHTRNDGSADVDDDYDVPHVIQCIERISRFADDDVTEARSGLSQLKEILNRSIHFDSVLDVEAALNEFDMDKAKQELVTLLNRMKKCMKEEASVEMETKSQKVLVVDDMPENIDVLMELLKSEYKVIGARSGEKAIELARSKQAPDIILLDINMPGISGFEVCRVLKDNDDTKDIPVIFITAESDIAEQAKGFELGAVDYITKPIVPVIVRMRVKTQLEIKKQNDLLSRLSTIDGLTQIANRRRFDDILEREWHRCMRNGGNLSLILMDIDHFKHYNDHYGHQAGDDCLRQVSGALLKGCMRETDLVARYGGEEFVAVLPDTDLDGALVVAERMRNMIAFLDIPHARSSAAGYVTLSQGVVTVIPVHAMTIHQFIERADQCLYDAKKSGRNRAVSKIVVL